MVFKLISDLIRAGWYSLTHDNPDVSLLDGLVIMGKVIWNSLFGDKSPEEIMEREEREIFLREQGTEIWQAAKGDEPVDNEWLDDFVENGLTKWEEATEENCSTCCECEHPPAVISPELDGALVYAIPIAMSIMLLRFWVYILRLIGFIGKKLYQMFEMLFEGR